jgi:Ca-activated chloride channel family protein
MSAWLRPWLVLAAGFSVIATFCGISTGLAADAAPDDATPAVEKFVSQGALRILQKDGGIVECPLKHTDVQADISGFVARVKVTQTFHNPTKEKIEAVYVFPLPHEGAVDDMTMVIGERKIVGVIKRRAEARSIYEQALLAGQTAALLEQERPNIFTQSVGNIEPGQEVKIEISYVDVLRYDMGTYEFSFPMVVGPRYIPGTPSGGAQPPPAELKGKVSPPVPNTDRVPDAERISPPVLKPGVRNGHDISLSVRLDAGVPIHNLDSTNHHAEIKKDGDRTAAIKLSPADSLPNKDFVLRYGVVGKKPEMAVLAHTGDYSGDRQKLGNGYFMLMIQPHEDERLTKSPPREIVFLVDVSGSMSGEPTAKVVEAMQGMLKLCRKNDTVQVITFASQAQKLFDAPVPVNDENIGKALGFTAGLQGRGGTEMLKGVQMAIDEPIDKERLRIVVMLTDGYIGNEAEIIEHVGKKCGDQIRFWCVGIGASPNMFLVDGVAKQGGGMGKKLGLPDETQPLVQEVMTRIQRAQLAKVKIDWGNFKVSETYPAKIPELWAGRPVIVYGRYAEGGQLAGGNLETQITVRGNVEGEDVQWPLTVRLPRQQKEHDVLAKVWARQKIEDLMHQSYYQGSPAVEEMVTAIALDYKLMSQYTSFVAVDESKKVESTEPPRMPRRMLVPVPLPAGTRWEGFFGEQDGEEGLVRLGAVLANDEKKSLKESKPIAALGLRRDIDKAERSDRLTYRRKFALPASMGPAPAKGALARLTPGGGAPGFAYAADQAPDGRFIRTRGLTVAGGGLPTLSKRLEAGKQFFGRSEALAELDSDGLAVLEQAGTTFTALASQGSKTAEAARKLLETATGKEAPTDSEKLRWLLTQACLLDNAAANVGQSDGSVAARAIERLAELHQKDIDDWAAKLPSLQTKLDLVLRDVPLAEALTQVGKAAKIDIRLVEGSVEDAAALVDSDASRITYLDLRRATAAQALDWICQPARLTWWRGDKGVIAGSERRREGDRGWVYDVTAFALPLDDELSKDDYNKAIAEAQKAADEFLAAIRKSLQVEDENSIGWFAPGQLLVFGSPERHAAVARIVDSLQSGKTPDRQLIKLAEVAAKRYTARKEDLAKAKSALRKLDVAAAHEQFGWQLLAAAVGGQLDLEALTELQIAWKSRESGELLSGGSRPLLLRSLWTICAAARALPAEKELAALAEDARQKSQSAVSAAVADLEKNRGDRGALASVIYAALANPDDREHRSALAPLLAAKAEDDVAAADVRLLGALLVGKATDAERQKLAEMIGERLAGPDAVTLAALACKQAGGELWEKFRAESRDLLGGQPLPGEVVVLVNRLALPGVSLTKAD